MTADPVSLLRSMIEEAGRIVFFTGAGISTESGIPDYRSPGGLWTRMQPIPYQDFIASEDARLEDWSRRFMMQAVFSEAEPGKAHTFMADLIRQGRASAAITQNIDGLHERSGVSPDRVVALHGHGTFSRCLGCGERAELDDMQRIVDETGLSPRCETCGELHKAAVISFGQALSEQDLHKAINYSSDCDLFIAVGSSLQVQPAASLPLVAKQGGARLALVNGEETPLDDLADCVIHGQIGPVFDALAENE
ncbi:SIR2 family NAD-dependent protein deacylase [Coralliovum pocilloporae]|uniref:SIR2 family NAD-dependent protein deacylase n=1 Tax=Coralliovum pocilloporae TaxID=3066369 RepID=UPI003307683F